MLVPVVGKGELRVRLVSDIHLEFYSDRQVDGFISQAMLPADGPDGFDVLVLAGDVGNSRTIAKNLATIAERYRYTPILYVMGNHEFYRGVVGNVKTAIHEVAKRWTNLHVLDDEAVEIHGRMFVGSTLWFPYNPRNDTSWTTNDFQEIILLSPKEIYDMADKSVEFLQKWAPTADVVITHYMPANWCVSPRWQGHDNRFFVNPVAETLSGLPKLWCFGHTHDCVDVSVNGCRFVSNPSGYPGEQQRGPKPWFDPRLTLKV